MSRTARFLLAMGGICEMLFYVLVAVVSGFFAWLFLSTGNNAGYLIGGIIVAGIVSVVIHMFTVTIPSIIYDVRDKS